MCSMQMVKLNRVLAGTLGFCAWLLKVARNEKIKRIRMVW